MTRRLLLACALAVLAAPRAGALKIERLYRTLSAGQTTSIEVVSGEAFVKFDPALPASQRAGALLPAGATILQEMPSTGWTVVGFPAGQSVESMLAALRSLTGVQAVEPNNVYRAVRLPNDPKVSQQYHLNKINAYGAWDFEVGTSSPVTIAVIDTGIESTHSDLTGKMVGTSRFYDPDAAGAGSNNQPATAACNHGTEVAGVAAASSDNSSQVAGVSWGASLISLKVFNGADCTADCGDVGPGCATSAAAIINAIDYARTTVAGIGFGRVVVNMSIGGSGACPALLQTAITNAVNAGLVLVAAAGNDGGAVNNPANCSGVIPVGATDQNDNIASFSSRGAELSANGLVAPGVGILTTTTGNTTASPSGTSFSSPIVAGVAALVLSKRGTMSVADVKTLLRNSAELVGASTLGTSDYKVLGNAQGAGRINANTAALLATKGKLALDTKDGEPIIFPNPFRPSEKVSTTIVLPTGAASSFQSLKIYTMDGTLVRDLKGQSWDGKNDRGNFVATGTYIVLVTTSGGSYTGKVAVIR